MCMHAHTHVCVYVCVSVSGCVDGWVEAYRCVLTAEGISCLGAGLTGVCRIPSETPNSSLHDCAANTLN